MYQDAVLRLIILKILWSRRPRFEPRLHIIELNNSFKMLSEQLQW